MPKGPQGQKRPADAIGNAIRVARIATGEEDETPVKDEQKAKAGRIGGRNRIASTTKAQREEIAKKGAVARHKG